MSGIFILAWMMLLFFFNRIYSLSFLSAYIPIMCGICAVTCVTCFVVSSIRKRRLSFGAARNSCSIVVLFTKCLTRVSWLSNLICGSILPQDSCILTYFLECFHKFIPGRILLDQHFDCIPDVTFHSEKNFFYYSLR